ncbi:NTP transferase domain-containing protein [Sphingomonas abaci]|uniref:NDP-sugar pyrophosphorylase family protein n=1 Tax=Sphingomonas abaci TaxID=237611 RepID=A0A7W7AIC8_9SPHN|nr:phosphocholine cytidylyltransferase family protein [Sphingomonas abaci]MBB4616587.1 NDP-sugar pyrophosphorylase family protein [Sphingomonas abaci]
MKAILLAAGQGSRLLPLTLERPKCLVPVGGRAILDHQLDACAAAGVEEAVVIGGYRIAQIAAHLAARPSDALPVRLVLNPFWAVASSIGSVWAARDLLGDAFLLMNGDTVFDPDALRFAAAHAGAGVSLLVDPLDGPAEPDDMLVTVAGSRVTAVAKTLGPALASHRSLGVVVARAGSGYAAALEAVIGGPEGIHAFHHAILDRLARDDAVAALALPSGLAWQEVDRPEDIARWPDPIA